MTDDKNLHIKNGSFYSLEEVRLLKPMTDDLFRELEPFVTVYPFGQNYRSNGAMPQAVGVINVNTAPLELIAALFSNRALAGDQDRLLCAQNLVKYRKTAVFRTKDDFKTAAARFCKVATGTGTPPLFSLAVDRVLSTSSQTFEVEAVGSAGDIERTIRTVLSRRDAQKPPKILYWKVI
jgi:type II secretory pathway component PulK